MQDRPPPRRRLLRLRRWFRAKSLTRAGRLVTIAALGAVAAVVLLGVTSRSTGTVGPGTIELTARVGPPRTVLRLPPFGAVSAPTHGAPVTLTARVDRIDIDAAQDLASQPRLRERIEATVRSDLTPLVRRFVLQTLGVSAVVGAAVGAVIPRRRWSFVAAGAGGALLATGVLVGLAWLRFDPEAFADQPRFEGPLERAPGLIETAQKYVEDFEAVRNRIDVLSAQLSDLYASATTEEIARGPGTVHILHVSDIHLNPVGLEVTRDLAERFDVDAIVDTGDFTTFGLPPEARFSDQLAGMPAPYYLIPGNHDSFGIRQALADSGQLVLVDGSVFTVGNVDILGVGHPVFTASNEVSDEVLDEALARQGAETESLAAELEPDVVAVHDPAQADGVDVPLVIAGHTHETTFTERDDGAIVLTVGSTGATGLGSFTVETGLPYEAQVLHFSGGRLVGIDAVSLRTTGEFEIERRLPPEPPEPDAN
ncbi:MAG: metallophosphoesterase family protein [Acidimicrobiales bacterium]